VVKPGSKEALKMGPCRAEYAKIHSEYFLFYHKKKVIGWFMGEMEDFETFYMRNTGVIPKHQSKGIYSAFLDQFIKYATELGYQRISSQHAPHNTKIYNLKMSKGFIIVGNENHERWGSLIKLVKFLNKEREKFFIKKFD
jgi:L-amino acid N-acyltransferase YncA